MGKLLMIQNNHVESPGVIEAILKEHGHQTKTIFTYLDQEVPGDAAGIDGLVVMGGPMGVRETDQFPFINHVLRLIDSCLTARIPILGICLGSQLLAHALGSNVSKAARKEIGWYSVELTSAATDDQLFSNCPRSFTPLHWHGDVFETPQQSVQLAGSELTDTQAFRHGSCVYGILFHIEITTDIVASWLTEFKTEITESGLDSMEISAGADRHLPQLTHIARTVLETGQD